MLRASCFVLRASCFVLRASCFVLRAACCVLRAACCVLRAAGCGLRAAGCGLRAAGCGLRAAGCGHHATPMPTRVEAHADASPTGSACAACRTRCLASPRRPKKNAESTSSRPGKGRTPAGTIRPHHARPATRVPLAAIPAPRCIERPAAGRACRRVTRPTSPYPR
ncbi:ABC transporter, substrate-binding protein, aliphatic sulfonate [Burkholderia pseudomallei BPC006]|nr:ABC transporter, substrate-binding protein, aliphatic sulfonate [Burkholderia pseudomallei BPC006]MUU83603.1 aliphatic sulfonate ABC transporter substrate-binding protein [Burkholderia pseudomallei]